MARGELRHPRGRRWRVLVVDDDPQIRSLVVLGLARDGFQAEMADSAPAALTMLTEESFDLIVLDVQMPTISGFDLLARVRESSNVPVIFLTGQGSEEARIRGLEYGADDYVSKPFSVRELSLRVTSVLRRARPDLEEPRSDFGDLVVDPVSRQALVDGQPVDLTPKEFDLLAFLAAAPRRAFSREELLEQVWGTLASDATVTEHIRRLRQKIERDAAHPERIVTVRSVGYRLEPDPPGRRGRSAVFDRGE